jgi:isochorismate synthase
LAAAGVAHRLEVQGPDRFTQLREQTEAVWARLRTTVFPGCPSFSPRFLGGFSFYPGNSPPPWENFGDGSFVLPRWTYREGPKATLTLCLRSEEEAGVTWRHEVLEELQTILECLQGGNVFLEGLQPKKPIPANCVTQLPLEEWTAYIARMKSALASGLFDKLVAARCCRVKLPEPLDEIAVVSRLGDPSGTTRFCFRRGEASFIGASPEQLVTKSGSAISTQALAGTTNSTGSIFPAQSMQSRRLLASQKDSEEHDFVVREIRHTLSPLCNNIEVADRPSVTRIGDIIHLNTPIRATLNETKTLPDLIAVMHPTPAVGGWPRAGASKWLAENEEPARGWYTGGVGWFDAEGDGEIVVAIRSGLLTPTEAFVYSGAGIVKQSDPAAEYEETALKQRPFLRALDVEGVAARVTDRTA